MSKIKGKLETQINLDKYVNVEQLQKRKFATNWHRKEYSIASYYIKRHKRKQKKASSVQFCHVLLDVL